ncbi:MAG TPA: hypothetical protein VEA41_15265, partial [Salinarimonas sp.]|nr:hypothetical protein [Salinarimonas sp.]
MRIVSAAALVATLSMPALAADLDYPPLRGTQIGADPVAHWSGAYLGGFAGVARSNFSFGAMTRDLVANDYRRTLIENEQSISRLANLPDADAQS